MGRAKKSDGLNKWERYRLKNLEEYRQKKREYAKTPEQRKKRAEYQAKWREKNRENHNEQARKSHHKNRHKHVDKLKNYHLLHKYGITLVEKNKMIEAQNGKCKICGEDFKNSRLTHLDHCHNTEKIRGILCSRCNGALGWFEKYSNEINNYLK